MKNKRSLILLLFLLIGLYACNNKAVPQGNSESDTAATVTNEPIIEATPVSSDEPTTEETPPASSDEPITEETPKPTETRQNDNLITLYEDFLNGKINATADTETVITAPDSVLSVNDIMFGTEHEYALFDMNNDGMEELLFNSDSIFIFSCQGDELFLWWTDNDMSGLTHILNNGDILRILPGAAPPHMNYIYLVLDESGAEKERVDFYKYDSDEDDTFEDFFFENEEHISQEEWEQKTEPYLSVSEIEWKEYTSSDEPTETGKVSGDYQFEVNENDTITIIKYIGDGGDVIIPAEIDGKKVTAIGNTFKETGAFTECETLTSVIIPNGVTQIQDNAFQSCHNLTTATVPASVEYLLNCAFNDCPNLQSVYFEGDAPKLGNYVIPYSETLILTVYYHEGASGWTNPWYGCPTETY